jgi:ABC-2 type transport system ATP-binding protein
MICDRVMIIHQGRLVPEDEIARMRSVATVIIDVRGDGDRIQGALAEAQDVQKVTRRDGAGGEGVHRFEVEGVGSGEAREAIVRKLVEIGCPPREMKSVGADLEEIFVRITARDM